MAGVLIGALAAFVVALTGHLVMWFRSGYGYESSGATQGVDLWSYYSMARAVWRSPNGITYSYPYELYWPTPPILFQLPITLLAWIGKVTGLPAAFEIGRIAGGAGSGAAIAALGMLYPAGFWRRWFYVAAVLGGGMFSVVTVAMALDTAGLPGLTEIYHYGPWAQDRLYWWLPYLASNLRMPLECIYHAMVIGALACLARRQLRWALVLGAAVWMSNPFSAVALHAAVLPWLAWCSLESRGPRRRKFAMHLSGWLAVNAAAMFYYGWFLNQWPLLRDLHALYKMQYVPPLEWWRLTCLTMPYGIGLLATIFSTRLRRVIWGRPVWRLFAILAVVHVLLIQQSAFLGEMSMQAYHYNRGYLQLGLVVVMWRVVIEMAYRWRCLRLAPGRFDWRPWHFAGKRCRVMAWCVCAIVAFTCMDQVLFGMYAVLGPQRSGMIDSGYAALVRKLPAQPAPAIVLTEPHTRAASYITAYSPHVAWDAEETMIVPFSEKRRKWLNEGLEGRHGGVAGLGIRYAILTETNLQWADVLKKQGWKILDRAASFLLFTAPTDYVRDTKTSNLNHPND